MSEDYLFAPVRQSIPEPLRESTLTGLTLRRVRTLLHTAPLHEFEANKGHREGWDRFDTRHLQLRAFELVLEQMCLGEGAERSTVVAELARLAGEMDPASTSDQRQQVAMLVVAWLLNETGADPAFQPFYLIPAEPGWRRGPEPVVLMREHQRGDNLYMKLTPPGINVLLGALNLDVADEQRAKERLLDEEIQRGRYDKALLLASQARLLSVQYEEEIAEVIRVARVDLRRLDWSGRVMERIKAAQRHIGERLADETQIAAHLLAAREDVAPEQAPTLDELSTVLGDCTRRHMLLGSRLMESTEVFLAEQERGFYGPGSIAAVDLGREIFDPLLDLPATTAARICDDFFIYLMGPRCPQILDLLHLLDDLFTPRREWNEEQHLVEEPELVEGDPDSRFEEADRANAAALLDLVGEQLVSLSQLLAQARSRHGPRAAPVLELLRYVALWACAPDHEMPSWLPRGLVAYRGEKQLDDPLFAGDDLLLLLEGVGEATS
jgi:hypothetical protein